MADKITLTISETVCTTITLDRDELRTRSLPDDLTSLRDLLATHEGVAATMAALERRPQLPDHREVTSLLIEADEAR